MRFVTELQRWLWYLNIAGDLGVVLTLWGRKLVGVYPILFLYFLADLLQSASGLIFGDPYYFYVYVVGQALKWILALWFVLDLYGRVLAPHPALAKFGRGAVGVLLGISVAASLPGLFLGLHNGTDPDRVVTQLLRFERTADATSAILLILISVVLLWFPIKVRRNAAAYMAGFVVYFVGHSAGLLASDLWPQLQTTVNTALLVLPIVCMLFWIMVMRPEGEIRTLTGHGWNPEEADRLRRKLDEINERLEKVLH
jgi:hypothetical protein